MNPKKPHFLLVSGTVDNRSRAGWHFSLESVEGGEVLEASDFEPASPERLELLAVVRGLEALDQPSRVTLLTSSRTVTRGLRFGLGEWKSNGWRWERFGRQVPIKNADLWKRVDRALEFHRVRCRTWRVDAAHENRPEPKSSSNKQMGPLERMSGRVATALGTLLESFSARTAT